MPSYDEIAEVSTAIKTHKQKEKNIERKTFLDYFSIALATFGVGFIPLAPGTWGSAVGILLYLFVRSIELGIIRVFSNAGFPNEITTAWIYAFNSLIFLLFCFFGVWVSGRAATVFKSKDPQKVVVDEVAGQLIVFLFVPFNISWKLVLAGFLLFRLFDIWKPYPINSLESLPSGLGVCADDILAGIYGGICLALLYAVQTSF